MNMLYRIPPLSSFLPLYLLTAVLCLLLYSQGLAQQDNSSARCAITLREIAAENSRKGIDPKLKDIKKDLSKLSYSTFRLEKTSQVKIKKGETKSFDLAGKNRLELTAENFEEGKIRLKVKLSPVSSNEKALVTTVRTPDGGTFLIGGPSYDGNKVLILALTARLED